MNFTVSLSDMFNKVSVGYSFVEVGTNTVGVRKTTTAVTDANSIAEFGTRELIHMAGGLSDSEAANLGAGLLARLAWPKGGLTRWGGGEEMTATIYCRGWWDTLFWQYANVSTTASTETTAQIDALITSYGPYITDAVFEDVTAVSSSNYRDGSKPAGEVIEALMQVRASTGLPFVSWVDINRVAYFSTEPTPASVALTMGTDGVVYTTAGERVRESVPQVGVYVRTSDIIPAVVDQYIIKEAGLQYIEESGWRRGAAYYNFRALNPTTESAGAPMSVSALSTTMLPIVADWIERSPMDFTPLAAPLTSTQWDGDAYSTTAKTLIDLSSVFGVPASVSAVLVYCVWWDSGSAGADCSIILSPNNTAGSGLAVGQFRAANSVKQFGVIPVPCDANGDIYYQITASGAGSMNVILQVWGYCLNAGLSINSTSSSIFGTSPNYAMFDTDGTLTLHGTATVFEDVVVNLSNIKAPASDPPTWTSYKGCEVPAFGKNATNVLYFTCQIPHKYKNGSDIFFHFHAAYPDANAGNSRWQLTYSWANINGTFGAQTTTPLTFAAPAAADHHSLHNFGTISGSGKTISSVLLCSLARLGADGADNYDNVIYAISADFHIEFDSLGSSQELVK
jgi:hypothetical protein